MKKLILALAIATELTSCQSKQDELVDEISRKFHVQRIDSLEKSITLIFELNSADQQFYLKESICRILGSMPTIENNGEYIGDKVIDVYTWLGVCETLTIDSTHCHVKLKIQQ